MNDFTKNSDIFYNAGRAGDGITVTFGDSVEKIPAYLFYTNSSSYSPNVTGVTIGTGVTSIGYEAFYNCSGLTSVTFEDPSGWQVSKTNNFSSYTELSSSDLSDPSTAATYIKSTYYNYYWRKV